MQLQSEKHHLKRSQRLLIFSPFLDPIKLGFFNAKKIADTYFFYPILFKKVLDNRKFYLKKLVNTNCD